MLKVRYQIQHQANVRVKIDKHRETPCVTHSIQQCRCNSASEQKLNVHDKYGETRYLTFFYFEDMMRVDADEHCEQVFNVT